MYWLLTSWLISFTQTLIPLADSSYRFYVAFPYRTAFSTFYGNDTITPIPDPNVMIGQRTGMSDTDIVKINRLYECGEGFKLDDSLFIISF